MPETINRELYKGFGFQIYSDLSLPELPRIKRPGDQAEITIEKADLKKKWEMLARPNSFFYCNETLIMFRIPDVAIYLIQNGNKIVVSPLNGASEEKVRLYLLGTCMGALLLQRKILPLHGSAIVINGKAYAIVGDSGAGKSTLARAFLKEGYELISDDIIPVSFTKENKLMVIPTYPQQKLWNESLQAFGMNSIHLSPIVERESKFAVPVQEQFVTEPIPLAEVFELVEIQKGDIQIHPIKNLYRLHTLYYHTYRNFLLAPSGLLDWHFSFISRLGSSVSMNKICRPVSRFTANELMDVILSTIYKEDSE